MADPDRKTSPHVMALEGLMAETPHEFGFFAMLRLLECLHADMPRMGTAKRPSDEPVRLAQQPALTFESATITGFKPRTDQSPRLEVRFLGLLGPNGPLPLHLTEYARTRVERHGDRTFAWFLDMFNHRMLSLFYRAWANNEPTVSFDRPGSDHFAEYIGSLIGLGMSSLRQRDDMPDAAKLHYCGRLSCQAKGPEGLEAILTDFFAIRARVREFIGEWVQIPEKSICRPGLNQQSSILGRSAVAGTMSWNCQHKFRIRLGPLDYDGYCSFLPINARLKELIALVRNYIGDELTWDVNLVLQEDQTPVTRLDGRCHLGWTTWLGKRPGREDADDLILHPQPATRNS